MGDCRVGFIALALVVVLAFLAVSPASAFSFRREAPPTWRAFTQGPDWLSGIVAIRPRPFMAGGPGALDVSANLTIPPVVSQYRVTNNPNPQNEVSIAINPRNGMNLLASANDYRGYPGVPGDGWCGVYSSRDGGRTWLEQVVPRNGPLTQVTVSGDPSVTFDADGNGYITCLGFSRTTNDNVVAVSKSTDGGVTWGTAVLVEGTTPSVFHDKPYMVADQTSGLTHNAVYVTWTRFISGPGECGNYAAPIYFSRSADGGQTFSTPTDISGAGYRCSQGSEPTIGPGGELYVSWVTGSRAVVTKSTDGGLTWSAKTTIAMNPPGEIYGGGPRTPHFPSIAVNPINAPGGNRVHVAWTDRRFGTADILMSTSVDGGVTFGAPVRVNDDPMNSQFFPWVAASVNGKVYVSFYDQRNDPNARLLEVYAAASVDFGASFQRNVKASAQFDPGTWFIGDYNGLAASGDAAYPVWCDLRNGGNEEVYIAGLPMMGRDVGRAMNP